jgi:hypothetical protein
VWLTGVYLITDTMIKTGRPVTAQVVTLLCLIPLIAFPFLEVQKT